MGVGDATLSRTYGDLFGIPAGTVLTDTSRIRGGPSGSIAIQFGGR